MGIEFFWKNKGKVSQTSWMVDLYFLIYADFGGIEFIICDQNFKVDVEWKTLLTNKVDPLCADTVPVVVTCTTQTGKDLPKMPL